MAVDITSALFSAGAAHLAAGFKPIVKLAERAIVCATRELRENLDGVLPVLSHVCLRAGCAEHVSHDVSESSIFLAQAIAHGGVPITRGHDDFCILIAAVGAIGDIDDFISELGRHSIDVPLIPFALGNASGFTRPLMKLVSFLLDLEFRQAFVVELNSTLCVALEAHDFKRRPAV